MNISMNRIHLDTIDSTSNYARTLLDRGECTADFTLIDSDDQTAGRGQRGNSWETEYGKNVIFSLVCHPVWIRPAEQYILSECIALAVATALQRNLPDEKAQCVTVKWPNDIYYKDSKISGTLIECDLFGKSVSNCIVGTGVNINQQRFMSDAPNPISLYHIIGTESDRESILLEIINEFTTLYNRVKEGENEAIHEEYKCRLYRNDNSIYTYSDENGTFQARIIDVEPSGRLILETSEGERRRYEFKEVKFIIG